MYLSQMRLKWAGGRDVITSRSHHKLKTYLNYQSAYGHQTWQDGSLPLWDPAHKDTWPFDYVVLLDHVRN